MKFTNSIDGNKRCTKVARIRLDPNQLIQLEAIAKFANMSVSKFLNRCFYLGYRELIDQCSEEIEENESRNSNANS